MMTKDNIQFDLLKTELELTQRQMDKYDQLSAMIKTWTVTLWAASLGWSFQSKQKAIILLSIIIVLAFWALDAVQKNFREDYKKRRDEVATILQQLFANGSLPQNITVPLLPLHKSSDIIAKLFELHVLILYLALVAIAAFLYFII